VSICSQKMGVREGVRKMGESERQRGNMVVCKRDRERKIDFCIKQRDGNEWREVPKL
jgi:hypothetical protein